MAVNVLKVSYDTFKKASTTLFVYYWSYYGDVGDGYVASCGNNDFVYLTYIKEAGDVYDFISTLLPAAEEVGLEGDLTALPGVDLKLSTTRYDIQETVIYIGKAQIGIDDNEVGWTIRRIVLLNGVPIDEKITRQREAVWDDREISTYYG